MSDIDAKLAAADRARAALATQLDRYPNVTGLGIGVRERGGRITDEVAVRVYVARKVPADALDPAAVLPAEIDGVPVDVIEAVFEPLHSPFAEHRREHNPLVGGISLGSQRLGGAGTLGLIVADTTTGEPLLLTNWHVVCTRRPADLGEAVVQPGFEEELGGAGGIVGNVLRAQIGATVDAAVIRPNGTRQVESAILGLGQPTGVAAAALLAPVRKAGRSTGVTEGVVVGIDETATLPYRFGPHQLHRQVTIRPPDSAGRAITQRGDSGSVWLDADHRIVALLCGGDTNLGEHAIANPIQAVFDALGVGPLPLPPPL